MTLSPVGIGSDVENAFDRCSEDVRRNARNFWYGLRLLPRDRFLPMCAIYAWMRRADDLADDDSGATPHDHADRRIALGEFRERTRALFRGEAPSRQPVEERHIWLAMGRTLSTIPLDSADFESMIDGQCSDLEPRRIEDMDALLVYCDQVASTVGRICTRVWGATDATALELASERGIAFQLTNILRDVREDHGRGRVYIPDSLLSAHELRIEDLLDWRSPDRCRAVVGALANAARDRYALARPLDGMIDAECRPTSWAMTTIYRSLLEKIAHRPRLVGRGDRIRLSSLRKIAIALRARRFAWYGHGARGGTVS